MNMHKSGAIRLLLVDDQPIVRAGLGMLLESWPGIHIVAQATDAQEAIAAVGRERPDVILSKLRLHDDDSLGYLTELMSAAPGARVLILTSISDPQEHWRAVHRGVMGVVLREQSPEVLLQAIKKVHAGEVWLDASMIARLIGELAHPKASHSPDPDTDRIAALTAREREVIALVCEGLHNGEIGRRLCISDSTVRHRLSSAYDKLGVSGRLELVIYAYRHGLVRSKRLS